MAYEKEIGFTCKFMVDRWSKGFYFPKICNAWFGNKIEFLKHKEIHAKKGEKNGK